MKVQRDYTGVPSRELAKVINDFFGTDEKRLTNQFDSRLEFEEPESIEIEAEETDGGILLQPKFKARKSDMQIWAEGNQLPVRSIRRIRNQEYQFTGLHLADKICCALEGPQLIHTLTIIPAENAKAALQMAQDEAEELALMFGPKVLDPARLAERAQELRDMRDLVLGEKTDYQRQMLRNDVARSQRRHALAN